MKIKPLTLALAALAVSPTAWGTEQESQSDFDFTRINATIENVMTGVVAANDRFSNFSYRFDPDQTNVEEDRYAVRMSLSGKAPWAKGGFESKSFFVVDHDPSGQAMEIKLSADAEIKTDTLAMLRHLAATSRRCPLSDQIQGALRVALNEDCRVHGRLVKANSLADLYQILEDHLKDSEAAFVAYRDDVRRAMDVAGTESLKHTLAQQHSLAEKLVQSVQNAQLLWNDDGITVSVSNFSLLGIAQHKNVKMQFKERSLRIQGDVTVTARSTLFMAAKPEFISMLRDMEEGAESSKRLIQMESRFWLRLIGDRIYQE